MKRRGPLGLCSFPSGSRYSMSATCGPRDMISLVTPRLGVTVFSMWESSWAPYYTLILEKTTIGMKLGLHGFGGGICGFVLGLHTHKKV
jgi:hypothetical protein